MATSRVDTYSRYIQYDSPNKERKTTVFLASFAASFATVNFGYALGYTAQAELKPEFDGIFERDEYKNTFSVFASVVALGALVGSFLAGWLIDKIGRKSTILCTSLLYTPGWLLITYSIVLLGEDSENTKVVLLYIGRIITGIGVGMSSLVVPVYIAEVASARTRGGFGNLNQLSINFGYFVSYTVGLTKQETQPKTQVSEFVPELVPVGISLLNVILMVGMPETPRWLLANNKRHEAIQALSWLRGYECQIEEECFEIESSLGFEDQQEKWTLADLKQPIFYRPLVIALLLMFFQEFSGINSILFYCTFIFTKAGVGNPDDVARTASISACTVLFLFTLISCILVDRVGRRKLFLTGSVVMVITLFLLGLYFYIFPVTPSVLGPTVSPDTTLDTTLDTTPAASKRNRYSPLALAATLLYIAFFSIGWGPLPWLLMSEFFPLKTRGLATSIVTFANWLFVFATTVIFDPMVDTIHEHGIFWFFAILTFFGLFFVLYIVPETKGKPLEDIQDLFLNNRIWRLNRPCGNCCRRRKTEDL